MASKTDVTVYIGRFSPFHLGHAHVLTGALESSKLVVVLVGSSGQSRSLKNPFTFDERKDMILQWWSRSPMGGRTNLVVLPLRDFPYNDTAWVRNVQRTVKKAITSFCVERDTIMTDIKITGSDRDETTWYLKSFPQWSQALVEPYRHLGAMDVSATEIRRWLFSGNGSEVGNCMPPATLEFLNRFSKTAEFEALKEEYHFVLRYKKAWEAAPYPPIFVTTDCVVIQSGHVLVVKRGASPGKGLWALPGGFLNQAERLRDGAIRELIEETGIRLAEGRNALELTQKILKGSIIDKEVFDKPDRSSRGRTITTAYLFRLDDTKPLPKVKGQNVPDYESGGRDIVETLDAFWLPIDRALTERHMWFEDHADIIETLVGGKDIM